MTLLGRNVLVSTALALSDFLSFTVSLYIAMGLLSVTVIDYDKIIPDSQTNGWVLLHLILAFVVLLGIQCACDIIFIGRHFGLN
ncbi:hypothetical protein [Klebsiella pneumoniae]|uniref:hypothetical protein n=1 Tax=Klebsiella pneumoniae TaxID=573 RepID=UPI000F1C1562|nr:hypothetical protein BANRA_01079 [Klebsiella pneumoniae]